MLNKINAFTAKIIFTILLLTMGTPYHQINVLLQLLVIFFQVRTWTLYMVFLSLWPYKHKAMTLTREQTGVKN